MQKDGLIYIKPVEGRAVRDPRTMLLVPAEGLWVPAGDMHWQGAIHLYGDVVEADEPGGEPPEPSHEEPPAADPEHEA